MKSTAVKFCALLAAAVSSAAFAATNVTTASRSVGTNNAPTPTKTSSSSATSGAYVDSISDSGGYDTTATSGSADQDSDIQPLVFSGTGSAHVTGHTGSPDNLVAESRYSVAFTTDVFYNWSISGTLNRNLDGGDGLAYIILSDNNSFSNVFSDIDNSGFGSHVVSGSGTIAPGFYTIEFVARSTGTNGGNSFATTSFTDALLTLTPAETPEPASLSMLALGGAALLMRRRK